MDERNGTMLGRYRLEEKIGEGGMAAVYRAFDTKLERQVAIKLITNRQQDSETFLKRFDREAKSLAKLSHPGIMDIHDYGDEDGLPYIVMEYLPNGTLKNYMGKPVNYQQAAKLLAPIADALAYAHQQGIVHRDVKPANILFSAQNRPMIGDFGIVKVEEKQSTEALTQVGTGIGTPAYMSPEQGRGSGVDHRTDIYALGVVFYELITGRRPYEAPTPTSFFLKQMTEPLPDPREFAPSIPAEVVAFIQKTLDINADKRLQSMDEFTEAMNRFAAGKVSQPMFEEAPTRLASQQESTMLDSKPGAVQPITTPPQRISTPQSQPVVRSVSYDSLPPMPVSTPNTGSYAPKKKKKTWIIFAVLGGLVVLGILCVIGLWILDPLFAPTDSPSTAGNNSGNDTASEVDLPNGSLMPEEDFYDCFSKAGYSEEVKSFEGLVPLVCDNFDDNRYGWYLDEFDNDFVTAGATINNGVMRMEMTSKDSYTQFWQWVPDLTNDENLSVGNFIIYFKIRRVEGPSETMIGFDYRENASDMFYSFSVYEDNEYMALEYYDGSTYTELSGMDVSNWKPNQWEQVGAVITGGSHYFIVDGNELELSDNKLTTYGELSLWVGAINPGETIVYEIDDLMVLMVE